MQAGRRYTFLQTLNWTKRYILVFLVFDTIPVVLYRVFGLEWMSLPWQPISLVGIAVAFYLGFKNNASYDRLWEARKIWGGIVNASRSFTVMARDFVSNDAAEAPRSGDELARMTKQLVHRHIGWLHYPERLAGAGTRSSGLGRVTNPDELSAASLAQPTVPDTLGFY